MKKTFNPTCTNVPDIASFEIGVFTCENRPKMRKLPANSSSINKDSTWNDDPANSSSDKTEGQDTENAPKQKSVLDNPVFRQLSKINGEINRMHNDEIKVKLRELQLDSRGKKDVIKKRLKAYYKSRKLSTMNLRDPTTVKYYYENFVIIDFEATCENRQSKAYRQEIIEFPAVLINSEQNQPVDEFHSFIKPTINLRLSEFCSSLTGITQDKVNFAPSFPEVMDRFEEWLRKHNLSTEQRNFAIVTDGPWDMGRFMLQQCNISKIPFPQWGKKWINLRKIYSNFYSTKRMCLQDMLSLLGLKFEGRPHSGMDDARNIARITQMLLRDGANLRVNERIHLSKGEAPDPRSQRVHNISRKEFEAMKPGKVDKVEQTGDESGSSDNEDLQPITDEYLQKLDKESCQPALNLLSNDDFPDLGSALKLSSK